MKERELIFIGHLLGSHEALSCFTGDVSFIPNRHMSGPVKQAKLRDGK